LGISYSSGLDPNVDTKRRNRRNGCAELLGNAAQTATVNILPTFQEI
jgi:hypothetical protein